MSSWGGLDLTEDDPRKPGHGVSSPGSSGAGSGGPAGGGSGAAGGRDAGDDSSGGSRPALQVYFKCANAYRHVLRAADGSGYCARCPKCGKVKQFIVGDGGVEQRTFVLSCR